MIILLSSMLNSLNWSIFSPFRRFAVSLLNVSALIAIAILIFLAITAQPAIAFTVTKTADTRDGTCDADCSLREAIDAANSTPGEDNIAIPAGTYTLSIAGAGENFNATGDLDITESVIITGAGSSATIIDANGIDRIFNVTTAGDLTLSDMKLIKGNSGTAWGGCVYAQSGSVTLIDSIIGGSAEDKCHTKANLTDGTNKNTTWKSVDRIHETVKGWGSNNEHTFSCSKCHVPHNTGLPRLMQTNCLNFNHRQQVVSGGLASNRIGDANHGQGFFPGVANRSMSPSKTFVNGCHESAAANGGGGPPGSNIFPGDGTWPGNELWNNVTPW